MGPVPGNDQMGPDTHKRLCPGNNMDDNQRSVVLQSGMPSPLPLEARGTVLQRMDPASRHHTHPVASRAIRREPGFHRRPVHLPLPRRDHNGQV